MPWVHGTATATAEQPRRTPLDYRTFRCHACRRICNERIGTPSNHLQYPTDVVLLVVLWRLRYKRSLRDLAEMFLPRGFVFTHETVRDWEARFAPLLTEHLRAKRHGQASASWYADETSMKVNATWWSLYRAIDREGNLVDARLSESRDMITARQFFRGALAAAGRARERVTTDGRDSYPRAIGETLGEAVAHRTSRYLNNRIEQHLRAIKQRDYPMHGFGSVDAAGRFCRAHEEQRQYFRTRTTRHERVSLAGGADRAGDRVMASRRVSSRRDCFALRPVIPCSDTLRGHKPRLVLLPCRTPTATSRRGPRGALVRGRGPLRRHGREAAVAGGSRRGPAAPRHGGVPPRLARRLLRRRGRGGAGAGTARFRRLLGHRWGRPPPAGRAGREVLRVPPRPRRLEAALGRRVLPDQSRGDGKGHRPPAVRGHHGCRAGGFPGGGGA